MRQRLYLETSTISAFHDERQPLRQRQTRRFWTLLDRYEVFVSALVLREIDDCTDRQRAQRLSDLAAGIPELEDELPEVLELTERYIQAGAFTARRGNDATHVAIATVGGIDSLISWNYRHLVRERARTSVQAINLQMGYNRTIRILTPADLMGDDDENV